MEPSYPCERRTLKPLRWNQMRPVTTALVALVAAVLAWLPATHSQAQPGARTTLYVGSGEMGVSAQSKTDVIAVLGPGNAMNAFEIVLRFDSAVVEPVSVTIDSAWIALDRGPQGDAAGQVTLAGFQISRSCQPSASCHLASIEWKGVAQGASALDAITVTLQDAGSAIGDVTVVAGRLQVGPPAANAASSSDASASTGQAPAPQGQPGQTTPKSSGTSPGALFIMFVWLAAMLVAGAVFVTAVARKSWRWAARPPNPMGTFRPAEDVNSEALAVAVADYFGKVEAFGRIAGVTGGDIFARDVVTRVSGVNMEGSSESAQVRETES